MAERALHSWADQKPLCRVDFTGTADLTRFHTETLKECIGECAAVPACKGLTYAYGSPTGNHDNCWLKGATDASTYTNEDDKHVQYVSLSKPVQEMSCFKDTQCCTAFAFGLVGTVLGVLSTCMSVVHSSLHLKDEHFRAILRTASNRRSTLTRQSSSYQPPANMYAHTGDVDGHVLAATKLCSPLHLSPMAHTTHARG
jgi:hypothetical protein